MLRSCGARSDPDDDTWMARSSSERVATRCGLQPVPWQKAPPEPSNHLVAAVALSRPRERCLAVRVAGCRASSAGWNRAYS